MVRPDHGQLTELDIKETHVSSPSEKHDRPSPPLHILEPSLPLPLVDVDNWAVGEPQTHISQALGPESQVDGGPKETILSFLDFAFVGFRHSRLPHEVSGLR